MKTFILPFSILIFISYTIQAQDSSNLLSNDIPEDKYCEEMKIYNKSRELVNHIITCGERDVVSGSLTAFDKTMNTFNSAGQLIESKVGFYTSNEDFKYTIKHEYSYNEDNQLAVETIASLESGFPGEENWVDYRQIHYTYDDLAQLVERLELFVPVAGADWENNSHELFTYNENGSIVISTIKYWNSETDSWWLFVREGYIYNQVGVLVEKCKLYSKDSDSDWTYPAVSKLDLVRY